jgi:hypothetical protein
MSGPVSPVGGRPPAPEGSYFFLSYATSGPGRVEADEVDPLISHFFDDLCAAIQDQVRSAAGSLIGFFDRQLPTGGDLKGEVSSALRSSQVLVPLYSPRYFATSWSMREQEVFRRRLETAATTSPERHLLPVIWTPFPSWDRPDEAVRALRSGPPDPDYQENGLRALHKLPTYHAAYQRVVGWLADRIVTVARENPLSPSAAPSLDDVDAPPVSGPRFSIAMLLPGSEATWSPSDEAERRQAWWRVGSGRQDLWVLDYVRARVERMGLTPELVGASGLAGAARGAPAILIVDPWVLAHQGEESIEALVRSLPAWVCVLLLDAPPERSEISRERAVATAAAEVLENAGGTAPQRVGSSAQLARALPGLIARLRGVYLRHGPVFPPAGPSTQRPPRLRDVSRIGQEESDHE